jgi:hypothetical protein
VVSGGRSLIVVLSCVLSAGAAVAAPIFWPARQENDRTIRVRPLPECRVHAVTEDGTETLHACGVSVSLPPHAHLVWIEQGNTISGQVAPPADAAAEVDLPLVAAGAVQVDVDSHAEQQRSVRLLHAGAVRFTRTMPAARAGEHLLMPAGTILVLENDRRGEVLRLGTGNVVPGRTASIRPAAPAQDAALVGLFTIPTIVATSGAPTAFSVNGDRVPELVIDHGGEVVTLWRLPSGPAEVGVRSGAYQFAPQTLRLRERGVATMRGELRPLPSLTVKIDVPESALAAWKTLEPALTIRRTADKKVVRQGDAAGEQEFALLPLDVYDAVLTAKPWTFVRRADLTAGADGEVEFAVEPFTISGRVMAGDEPAAATVAFRRGNGDTTTTHTDADGEYEVTLWMRDMYIVETILDANASDAPFSRAVRLTSTRRFDIRVPRTKVVVQVTDAVSSKPVAGAEVTTFNRWDDPRSGKGTASHTVTTDENGLARLAPLTAGTAEIHVLATGYFKDEPVTIDVQDEPVERTVAVKVRPAGATAVVRIVLPGGAPASDADVMVVRDTGGWQPLWSARADAQGSVSVPRALAHSIVLVRHPAAAGLARRFQDLPEQEYRLVPASPQPLLVNVKHGGDAAGNVAITVWFHELPLTGAALEFLLGAPTLVPANGLWTGRNLPREPVRILASSGMIDAQIAAGAYDALATIVPEPRPNQVTLTVVD